MEAPGKIYLQQYDEDTLICLNDWNISEEWTTKPCNEKNATNIEYTRTIVHAYLDGVEIIKAVIIREEQFPEPDYDEHKAVLESMK